MRRRELGYQRATENPFYSHRTDQRKTQYQPALPAKPRGLLSDNFARPQTTEAFHADKKRVLKSRAYWNGQFPNHKDIPGARLARPSGKTEPAGK